VLYKRFANCASAEQLEAMQEELVDRFGDLRARRAALIESHRCASSAGARRRAGRRRSRNDPAPVRAGILPSIPPPC